MIFFNFDSYVILVGLHTILVIPVSKTTRYPHPHLHSSEFKREGHPCQRIYIYLFIYIFFCWNQFRISTSIAVRNVLHDVIYRHCIPQLGACETGALAPQIAICLPSCKLINTDVGTPPFVDHFLEKTEDVPHLVGGLKQFFIFHNIWDNPSHWLSYFSRWLKPPTRHRLEHFLLLHILGKIIPTD